MFDADPVRRAAPLGLAILFTVVTLCFGGVWIRSERWQPPVSMGARFQDTTLWLSAVDPDGAAAEAGLRPHDQLIAINGEDVDTQLHVTDRLRRMTPDTTIRLTVRLAGLNQLRSGYGVLRPSSIPADRSWSATLAHETVRSFPVLFILCVCVVLLLLFDYRDAWLMALGLCGTLVAFLPFSFESVPPELRGAVFAYKILLGSVGPAALFYLFAVFPMSSPLEEIEPRLKTGFVALSMTAAVPAAVWVYASPLVTQGWAGGFGFFLAVLCTVAAVAGSMVSIVGNSVAPGSAERGRKARVVAYGIGAGTAPLLLLGIASLFSGGFPTWVELPVLLTTLLVPVTLGYVMFAGETVSDPPVALGRAVRFFLVQRGHLLVLAMLGAVVTLPVAEAAFDFLEPRNGAAFSLALLCGAVLTGAIVWVGNRFHGRLAGRLDRLLFGDTE